MKYSKINIDRAPLTEMDVERGRDFTQVLKGLNKVHLPWYKSTAFLAGSVIIVAVAVVVGGWMMFQNLEASTESAHQPIEMGTETLAVKELIQPPVEGYDKEFVYNTVSASADTTLVIDDSRLMIPANAFVTVDGEPVEGEVDILYREYHDKYDIIFSGIPMGYDSAGTHYQFESAGMFEIRGKKDGQDVFLAPDRSIEVEMSSLNAGDEFNSYMLNEETGVWDYLGDSDVVIETLADDSGEKPGHQISRSEASQIEEENNSAERAGNLASSSANEIEFQIDVQLPAQDPAIKIGTSPMKPKKASAKNYQINFDYDKSEFPELGVYDNMLFEVSESNKNFQKEQSEKTWNDIKIRRGAEEGSYVLTFSRPGDRFSVMCYPVVDGADMEGAMAKYEQAMQEYEAKEAELKKEQEEREAEARAAAVKRRREARYAQAVADTTAGYYSNAYTRMYRVFNVSRMGIYNSDCGRMYPSDQAVMARYYTPNGDEVSLSSLYLVDNNRNISFVMPVNQISFDRISEYSIIGITTSGEVAYSRLGRIQHACESSECDITIKLVDDKVDSVSELRDLLKEEISM